MLGLGTTAILNSIRNKNNYELQTPKLTSQSRATTINITDKIEYTKLSDGSEEILVRNWRKIYRYQNFDEDTNIDRIRIDKHYIRDIFRLENILIRSQDYSTNKSEFDTADKILKQERIAFEQRTK